MRLAVNNRDSVIEHLVSNEVDLAIMGRSPQALETVAEAFAQNPHVIIAAPDHPLARERRIAVDRVREGDFHRARARIGDPPGDGTVLRGARA